jgi:hypothetical protein
MVEQIEQEPSEVHAQSTKKGRSKEEKIGRLKYNQYLLKRVLTEIGEVKETQRIILNGLKGAGYFHFDVPLIQKLACVDVVDLEILDRVHVAGRGGVLPKDVAKDLFEYGLKHYHVSRRILRMNKRMAFECGERVFEKRGWRWALTVFGFEAFGDVERKSLEEFTVEPKELEEKGEVKGDE